MQIYRKLWIVAIINYLVLFCFNLYAFEPYETANGEVILTDFSQSALWQVYVKNGKPAYVNFDEKTPEGETAITYEIGIKDTGKKTTCRTHFFEGGGKWRKKKFNAISFWVKGDGSGSYIQIRFLTRDRDDGLFTYQFYLTNKGWEYKTIPLDNITSKSGKKLDISKVIFIGFRSTQKLKVSIGPVKLEPKKEIIFLQEIPHAKALFVENAPKIDGKLDEECWGMASSYKLQYTIKSNNPLKEATTFKILYDKNNIYIGAILDCTDTSELITNIRMDGDFNLFSDDCFEILIDSNNDMNTYYHFAINALGYKLSYRRAYDKIKDNISIDKNWNPEWIEKCRLEKKKWYIECAIPISILGIQKIEGKRISFQIGRENHLLKEYSIFAPTDKFPIVKQFGILEFCRNSEKNQLLEKVYFEKISKGKFRVYGIIKMKKPGRIGLFAEITNPEGEKYTAETSMDISKKIEYFSLIIDYPAESEGEHHLSMRVSDGQSYRWKSFKFQHCLPVTLQYGKIIINPKPKYLKWGNDFFTLQPDYKIYIFQDASERTVKTAKFLAEELYDFFGEKFQIVKVEKFPKNGGIVMGLKDNKIPSDRISEELIPKIKNIPSEGYVINTNNNGITLIGTDEPGLYYSVVTLMQIIKGPMKISKYPKIKKVKIIDWPDLKYRYYSIMTSWWWKKKKDFPGFKWFKDYIKRMVAGQKFNIMVCELTSTYLFEHNPKLQYGKNIRELRWTKKRQLEIAKFCREHFIEFVPFFGSSRNMMRFKTAYPELFVNGKRGDPTHPLFYKVLLPALDEIIEGTHCKYVHIGHDEWWGRFFPPTKSDLYKGIPARDIFLKDVKIFYEHLKAKGIKVMMYADMILKNHNGDAPFGLTHNHYKIAPLLPKDIIMVNWSVGTDPLSNQQLHRYGFKKIIAVSNGFRPCPKDRYILSGFGILTYGFSHMMAGVINDKVSLQYGYTSVLRAADYAWNIKRDPGFSVKEFERRRMKNIQAINSIKPNPAAGFNLYPISIQTFVNENLKNITGFRLNDLPSGRNDFGFIPMALVSPRETGGKNVIALIPSDKTFAIPVSKKISSIYFLQGCYIKPSERKKFYSRSKNFLLGIPIATYSIIYEDGTKQITKARFGLNIVDISPPVPRFKFLSEVRYFRQERTSLGQLAFIYQYEWVNPYPHKKVERIILQSTGTEAIPIIFAITVRDIKPKF